jgi:hypothetical protein
MSPQSDTLDEESELEECHKRRKTDLKGGKAVTVKGSHLVETIENDGKEVLLRMFELKAISCKADGKVRTMRNTVVDGFL